MAVMLGEQFKDGYENEFFYKVLALILLVIRDVT